MTNDCLYMKSIKRMISTSHSLSVNKIRDSRQMVKVAPKLIPLAPRLNSSKVREWLSRKWIAIKNKTGWKSTQCLKWTTRRQVWLRAWKLIEVVEWIQTATARMRRTNPPISRAFILSLKLKKLINPSPKSQHQLKSWNTGKMKISPSKWICRT